MNPKFRIEQRSPKFELTWHRQLNASDCGPMVILNLMLADGIQGATSVGEARGAVGMMDGLDHPRPQTISVPKDMRQN